MIAYLLSARTHFQEIFKNCMKFSSTEPYQFASNKSPHFHVLHSNWQFHICDTFQLMGTREEVEHESRRLTTR